jgi:hypothetical protein
VTKLAPPESPLWRQVHGGQRCRNQLQALILV